MSPDRKQGAFPESAFPNGEFPMSGGASPFDELVPQETSYKSQIWMLTFADLLSLILCFFVLLFAMNAVELKSWDKVVTSLSDRLNPAVAKTRSQPSEYNHDAQVMRAEGTKIEYLATLIAEKISDDPILAGAHVRLLEDRVAISVPADLLFYDGSSQIADQTVFKALNDLASTLSMLDNEVSVVGYSEGLQKAGDVNNSRWELSLERALTIARILRQSGYRKPLAAYAYGERRFGDLINDLPDHLQSRFNRRVDIIIRRDEIGRRIE